MSFARAPRRTVLLHRARAGAAVALLSTSFACLPAPTRPAYADATVDELAADAAPALDASGANHRADGPVRADGPASPPDAPPDALPADGPVIADAGTPTFDDVAQILDSCNGCHSSGKQVTLNNDDGGLYARLTTPSNKVMTNCALKRLVVPNHPEMSLLYLKIAGMTPANCGVSMPKGAPPLPSDLVDTIAAWIRAGAPK